MEKGSAVRSKAGSDTDKLYVVVGFDAKGYALVCDGARHPLSAPKKKNVRHLTETGECLAVPKTDAALRTALRRLVPKE